jgi:hypothetical protein
MKKTIAASFAAILAVVTLVVGASTANAQPTGSIDIALGDQGELIGKGAVVVVPSQLTCSFEGNLQFGEFQVALRQATQGGKVLTSAMGGGVISASDCDGATHTVDLYFFPSEVPFRSGVAVIGGSASIFFVDPDTNEQGVATDSETVKEIRLKN